jgi:hypothetical protein
MTNQKYWPGGCINKVNSASEGVNAPGEKAYRGRRIAEVILSACVIKKVRGRGIVSRIKSEIKARIARYKKKSALEAAYH